MVKKGLLEVSTQLSIASTKFWRLLTRSAAHRSYKTSSSTARSTTSRFWSRLSGYSASLKGWCTWKTGWITPTLKKETSCSRLSSAFFRKSQIHRGLRCLPVVRIRMGSWSDCRTSTTCLTKTRWSRNRLLRSNSTTRKDESTTIAPKSLDTHLRKNRGRILSLMTNSRTSSRCWKSKKKAWK